MEMLIDFPGGARVDAHFDGLTVRTDQPPHAGGAGSAPTPFATFLASLGTCAGIYVLAFCQRRGIPTDGIRLVQTAHPDPVSGMIGRVTIEIRVPPGFPEEYHQALVRSAAQCAVKKHLEHPPEFEVTVAR